MKIIGHRGAAALAPENSLRGINLGLDSGVDGVEIDVRLTRDKIFAVIHDTDLYRLGGTTTIVANAKMAELRKLPLHSGESICSLTDIMHCVFHHKSKAGLYIDAKGDGWSSALADTLNLQFQDKIQYKPVTVMSFNIRELHRFKKLCHHPVMTIRLIHPYKFWQLFQLNPHTDYGVGLRTFIVSRLLVALIHRNGLKVYVYTCNNPGRADYFKRIGVDALATDRPDLL